MAREMAQERRSLQRCAVGLPLTRTRVMSASKFAVCTRPCDPSPPSAPEPCIAIGVSAQKCTRRRERAHRKIVTLTDAHVQCEVVRLAA